MTFTSLFTRRAALQVQKERVWLLEHRGRERADGFEAELAHVRELLEEHPEMGPRSPWSATERRVFLPRSRYHVYYRLYPEDRVILLVRLRHEKQGPER